MFSWDGSEPTPFLLTVSSIRQHFTPKEKVVSDVPVDPRGLPSNAAVAKMEQHLMAVKKLFDDLRFEVRVLFFLLVVIFCCDVTSWVILRASTPAGRISCMCAREESGGCPRGRKTRSTIPTHRSCVSGQELKAIVKTCCQHNQPEQTKRLG